MLLLCSTSILIADVDMNYLGHMLAFTELQQDFGAIMLKFLLNVILFQTICERFFALPTGIQILRVDVRYHDEFILMENFVVMDKQLCLLL